MKMENLKITLELNVSSPEKAQEFFKALSCLTSTPDVEATTAPSPVGRVDITAKSTKTKTAKSKAKEAPAQAEEAPARAEEAPAQAEEAPARAEEAPAQVEEAPARAEEAPAQAEEAPASVSLEDIRKLIVEKANNHRAAIREKLNALGAPNATALDPSKYNEFYNFLNSLA